MFRSVDYPRVAQLFSYAGKHFESLFINKNDGCLVFRPSLSKQFKDPHSPLFLPSCNRDETYLNDFFSTWDVSKFEKRPYRSPIVVGDATSVAAHFSSPLNSELLKYHFSSHYYKKPVRVLDMPIKFPHSDEYRLPTFLQQFQHYIEYTALCEHHLLKLGNMSGQRDPFYCYLTIDQSFLQPKQSQRVSGCHVDGFQGERINPKVLAQHSFVMYDCLPTIWNIQDFQVSHLDEKRDNFFTHFDKQENPCCHLRLPPFNIILFDAYQVHKADVHTGSEPLKRTFFRMTYSIREFDRLGNTHNPFFKYNWNMVARDVSKDLK